MARGQRDPALERRWRVWMVRWRSSGLSVREFCRQHRLIETSFYYWKRELRARDAATASVSSQRRCSQRTAAERPRSISSPSVSLLPKFVPVTVLPSATVAVEVRCPSGHVVLLSSCDAVSMISLFAALNPQAREAPPC